MSAVYIYIYQGQNTEMVEDSGTFVGSLAFCGVMQPAAHMALHSSPSIVLTPGLNCMPCRCRRVECS